MQNMTRETVEYDVVIVGGGPAGLSAAIHLKQLDPERQVIVLEKGAEIGAHTLSGAVLDPSGLDRLIPNWQEKGAPIKTQVAKDSLYFLGPSGEIRIPHFLMPPLMHNKGNYVVSMGNVCRWLAQEALDMGVEIFPAMACSELIYDRDRDTVSGVVAGELGLDSNGNPGPNYEPGMEVHGRYVLLAEGARGSLAKQVIAKFKLDRESDVQKYGLGLKEIWEIDPKKHQPGRVCHMMGWPLGVKNTGGAFLYHMEDNQISIGLVVDLSYKNPYLSPYKEFQKLKRHPLIANVLAGGRRVAYGARSISKGGLQSLPKMSFPGGLLIGCAAGLVNLPRIKGNHNAIHSGIEAALCVHEALSAGRSQDDISEFDAIIRSGVIGEDLRPVRNVAPLNGKFGLLGGVILGGIDMWVAKLLRFNLFGTLRHGKSDAACTQKACHHKPIEYPKPDGVLDFDLLTNLQFSNVHHEEGQPSHLKLVDADVPIRINLPEYAEPAQFYCPAGVYEIIRDETNQPVRFQINAQNCLHCKTCDIKDPLQNIIWTTPQGGGGPNYPNM